MDRVIAFALRRRVLVVVMLLAVLVAGGVSFANLNIEAYPDPVPPLVDVVTQWPGQSAEEIERYVTIPIEIALASIPHVTAVRTSSLFGLSDVKVQFRRFDRDFYGLPGSFSPAAAGGTRGEGDDCRAPASQGL